MPAFNLSKWYLDCVTDSGETSILYVGSAGWGMAQLHYSSLLESKSGHMTVRSSICNPRMPEIKGASISWRGHDIDATWNADSTAIRNTIFSCERGAVEWHCLMPRARVQFGRRFGFGYVEQLTMSIPPWALPIENLRWGRFTSASDWIVWIDWEGEFSRRIVYLNGEEVATSVLQDGRLSFDGGTLLTMDQALVIRDAPLDTGALSGIPVFKKMFPARLRKISECKWRSRALLERPGRSSVEGWAIHESVSWPR
jgi:hypothetical protein